MRKGLKPCGYCSLCGYAACWGKIEEAEDICRTTGICPPQEESAFQRDCLAYFLMTITTDGLEEYQYEG
ncbi:MAG: hypothetical protein NTY37_05240 [Methanothrix sp.]|nr:hypothetical protein [Methanothrix sp.]